MRQASKSTISDELSFLCCYKEATWHSHVMHAMRHTHIESSATSTALHSRQRSMWIKGFDICGRTLSTLQPLLDDVAPSTRRVLSQGLEDYDSVRSKVMGAHATGQGYVGALRKNVPEQNLR